MPVLNAAAGPGLTWIRDQGGPVVIIRLRGRSESYQPELVTSLSETRQARALRLRRPEKRQVGPGESDFLRRRRRRGGGPGHCKRHRHGSDTDSLGWWR